MINCIMVGDRVHTIKGAAFEGVVLTFYQKRDGSLGAVVEAVHPQFVGSVHVYPTNQIVRCSPPDTEDGRMLEEEARDESCLR